MTSTLVGLLTILLIMGAASGLVDRGRPRALAIVGALLGVFVIATGLVP